jgi:ADP-ribosylglycohydrolase
MSDNAETLEHARDALEGLSVGDAFGEQFFALLGRHDQPVERRMLSAPPWEWTDDTSMALSIFATLRRAGAIDPAELAQSFVDHYDVQRAYGPSMNRMLREAGSGRNLPALARQQFGGQGSHGNGAAMRVAPLGAFLAADLAAVVEQAARSAEVTHTHPEAVAGAIAVAVAAAQAVRLRGSPPPSGREFIDAVLPLVPASEVASRLRRARDLIEDIAVYHAAAILGSGSAISAQDTVPYALWCAGRSLGDYAAALWLTASGLGDIDTTCAIVGGIVASYTGRSAIPPAWQAAREPLPDWAFLEG